MAFFPFANEIAGGIAIGLASAILLVANGRVAGVNGILRGFLFQEGGRVWRGAFLAGLVIGAAGGGATLGDTFPQPEFGWPLAVYVASGLLVGAGVTLSNGCTSGHGISGTARFSPRSLAATAIFVAVGAAVVGLLNAAS